jgi:DNA topoisomerase-3
MIVVIAEKSDQANKYAEAFLPNGHESLKYAIVGRTVDNEQLAIVIARGHLYRLAEPEEYDPTLKAWRKDSLPWLPTEIKILPMTQEAERIATINTWLRRLDLTEVVHACDPDREGQLIGDDIIEFAGLASNVVVTRLWSNSLEPTDLLAAWAARKSNDIDEYNFLKIVGNCRRELDMLLGVDGTRWLTLDAREKGHSRDQLYPYGRVQTTTLAFVVERERERDAFVATPYFVVAALFRHARYPSETELVGAWTPNENTPGVTDKRLLDPEVGQKVANTVKGLPGTIRIVDRRDIPDRPPLPHKMISLQQEANRRYGMTARETMAATQSLYEDGVISYPGTQSRLLPESTIERIPAIWQAIAKTHPKLAEVIPQCAITNAKNVFVPEADLGGSHPAIIPTRKALSPNHGSWTLHKKRIYDIIARTFVANFLPNKITTRVTIIFDVAGHKFDASRSFVKSLGWESVLPPLRSNEKKMQPLSAFWSEVDMNETVFCADAAVKERKTPRPLAFTDATILEEMENAHKRVSDDDLRVVLQQAEGLGTGRTRDEILESLLERKLMARDGTTLVSTNAGKDLVDSVPDFMKIPDFTAETERMMIQTRQSGDRQNFRNMSHQIVQRMIVETHFVPSRVHPPAAPKRKRKGSGSFQREIRPGDRQKQKSAFGQKSGRNASA